MNTEASFDDDLDFSRAVNDIKQKGRRMNYNEESAAWNGHKRLNTDQGYVPPSYCDQYREFFIEPISPAGDSNLMLQAEAQFIKDKSKARELRRKQGGDRTKGSRTARDHHISRRHHTDGSLLMGSQSRQQEDDGLTFWDRLGRLFAFGCGISSDKHNE